MATQLKKLKKGTTVTLRGIVSRIGHVVALNSAGFYTVEWKRAMDTEGLRCIKAKELRQYRREELVALDANGDYDNEVTVSPADGIAGDNLLTESETVTDVPLEDALTGKPATDPASNGG